MNVYDQAHQLAAAIKESEEFKQYDSKKKLMDEKPELGKMIKDFHEKSMEIQIKQMSGEQPDSADLENIQKLYQIVAMDPLAAGYIDSEMRFSLMMKDVYEIIGEAIGQADIFK